MTYEEMMSEVNQKLELLKTKRKFFPKFRGGDVSFLTCSWVRGYNNIVSIRYLEETPTGKTIIVQIERFIENSNKQIETLNIKIRKYNLEQFLIHNSLN